MIIYQAEYKYIHQIEPDHKIIGYFKSKQSAIDVLVERFDLGLDGKMILGNNYVYSKGNARYRINEVLLED